MRTKFLLPLALLLGCGDDQHLMPPPDAPCLTRGTHYVIANLQCLDSCNIPFHYADVAEMWLDGGAVVLVGDRLLELGVLAPLTPTCSSFTMNDGATGRLCIATDGVGLDGSIAAADGGRVTRWTFTAEAGTQPSCG
jgi:hypothetical protein